MGSYRRTYQRRLYRCPNSWMVCIGLRVMLWRFLKNSTQKLLPALASISTLGLRPKGFFMQLQKHCIILGTRVFLLFGTSLDAFLSPQLEMPLALRPHC